MEDRNFNEVLQSHGSPTASVEVLKEGLFDGSLNDICGTRHIMAADGVIPVHRKPARLAS